MASIERYLEGKLPGLKVINSKRKPGALAMLLEYRGKTFPIGFVSPTGAGTMIARIKEQVGERASKRRPQNAGDTRHKRSR